MNREGKTIKVYNTDTKVLISKDQDYYNMKEDIKYMLHLISKTEGMVDRNMTMMHKCYGFYGIAKYQQFNFFGDVCCEDRKSL